MDCAKLFKVVDDLSQEYLDFLIELVKIESPTEYKDGVDSVCKLITDRAREKGFEVDILYHPIVGTPACITLNPNASGKPVCISGHMDTVHAVGSLGKNPVRYEGDKLYGPGVNDCKGGIVAGFLAMDALDRIDFRSRPVKLILQSDEENNSKLSQKATLEYMINKAGDCVCFLNCEPNRVGITVERKGIVCFKYTVKGLPAHSAECVRGKSAIAEACHKILELEKLKSPDSVTCNCGIISGGVATNTVPGECTFFADFRYKSQEDYDFAVKYAQKVANTAYVDGTTCSIEQASSRKSLEFTEKNRILYDKINKIYTDHGFPYAEKIFASGGADSAEISSSGIPCLDGFGVRGANIHTDDEFIYHASLSESAKKIALIACCIED